MGLPWGQWWLLCGRASRLPPFTAPVCPHASPQVRQHQDFGSSTTSQSKPSPSLRGSVPATDKGLEPSGKQVTQLLPQGPPPALVSSVSSAFSPWAPGDITSVPSQRAPAPSGLLVSRAHAWSLSLLCAHYPLSSRGHFQAEQKRVPGLSRRHCLEPDVDPHPLTCPAVCTP